MVEQNLVNIDHCSSSLTLARLVFLFLSYFLIFSIEDFKSIKDFQSSRITITKEVSIEPEWHL
jgi:hypothetical protein